MKLTEMTNEELREVCKQRKKNGCYTAEAKRAQGILRARVNPWINYGPRNGRLMRKSETNELYFFKSKMEEAEKGEK